MEGAQSWGAHVGCSGTVDNLLIDRIVTCHNLVWHRFQCTIAV